LNKNILKIGTAFSGIGAKEQAVKNLNIPYRIEFACEIDRFFRTTYLNNYFPLKFYNDWFNISSDWNELPDVDLFMATIPNNMPGDFSRKKFEYIREKTFKSIHDYLKAKKPDYFIIEDTPKIANLSKHQSVFGNFLDYLGTEFEGQLSMFPNENALDYGISWRTLKNCDFGTPLRQSRLYIVGVKNNKFTFPNPKKKHIFVKDILEDLHPVCENTNSSIWLKKKISNKILDTLNIKLNINDGLLLNEIIESTDKSLTDKSENFLKNNHKVYSVDGLSPSFTGKMSLKQNRCDFGIFLVKNRLRALTVLEVFRLMGFPDDFNRPRTKLQGYRQASNSSCVPVYESLIEQILKMRDK